MSDNEPMSITEFLEARIAEDEARFDLPEFVLEDSAHGYGWGNRGYCPLCGAYQFSGMESVTEEGWWAHAEDAHRMRQRLAECAAKRAIIEQHKDWPVLVEKKPEFTEDTSDIHSMTYRVSQEMVWLTEREYVKRFGVEAPTTNMILALAAIYKDHPDYQQDWAL